MISAEEVSDWEGGYTADLGGGRCPINRHHCASTPNNPGSQDQRFDTQYGRPDLSTVNFGSGDPRGAAGLQAQHPHPSIESEGSDPSRRRDPRRVRFGMGTSSGAAGASDTVTGGRISPLPAAASVRPNGRANQSAPATHGGGEWGLGSAGDGEAGGLAGREAFGGARLRDVPRVAQPRDPMRRPSPIPTEPSSRANQSAPVGQAVGARSLDDVEGGMAGGRAGMEASGGPLLGDPLRCSASRSGAAGPWLQRAVRAQRGQCSSGAR